MKTRILSAFIMLPLLAFLYLGGLWLVVMNRLELSPDQLFCGYTENSTPALIRETAEILEDCSKEEIRDINRHIAFVKEMARERKK